MNTDGCGGPTYPQRLQAHLAGYKARVLGIPEHGTWGQPPKPYPHILPSDQWDANLLEPIRAACCAYIRDLQIDRHRGFHHLTSS